MSPNLSLVGKTLFTASLLGALCIVVRDLNASLQCITGFNAQGQSS